MSILIIIICFPRKNVVRRGKFAAFALIIIMADMRYHVSEIVKY